MDDRRFDDLTKLVGRRASRRVVIRAALAGAIVSVFGGGIAEAALSTVKTRPRLCIQPGQPCGRPGVDPSRDCCYKCNSSTHKCCEDIGYLCTADSDCCVKVVNGVNVQPICRDTNAKDTDRRKSCQLPGSLPVNAQCVSGSECASGNCAGGVCAQCPAGKSVCGSGCCDPKQCQICSGGVCKIKCGPCQTCDGNGNCLSTCTKCQTCAGGVCTPKTCGPCQTCNPDTGLCQTTCSSCQVCKNNVCVAKCNTCQTCNPATGVCTDKLCASKCEVCNPATGVCSPKTCGQCQTCNPDTGQCQNTCNKCQSCRGGVCVDSVDCSTAGIGCLGKACDPATGLCTIDVPLTGIPCDDGNGCTYGDTCVDGVCVGVPQVCGACEACVSTGSTTFQCETLCLDCEVCDPYTNTCVYDCETCCPSEFCGCLPDADGNPVCVFTYLGYPCETGADCPLGLSCIGGGEDGFCAAEGICTEFTTCPEGSVCLGSSVICQALCPACLVHGCGECEVCNVHTGACDPILCDDGETCCHGECVDLLTDAENCNTCGNICEFSVPCTNGVCCIPDGGFCDQTGNEGCCGGVCCNCSDFSNDFTCASSVDECPFCPE